MKNELKILLRKNPKAFLGIALMVASLSAHAATKTLPDSSLYTLRSIWTDDAGHKMKLDALQGKPRLFVMFFGHCQTACPMTLGRLKTLESKLPHDWGRRGGFVMVTLDPRRDDSGALAQYRKDSDLRIDRYTLLRGNPEDTRELAMLLGINYGPSPKNGGIDHTVAMVLLDRKGRVLRRDTDLEDEAGQLKALRDAIADSGR